ncbi:protein hu-li tai shao-like isoform X3 [Varroa jacobsoni]|uniref:Class II aldolase/adducin N-terminal domain-containing protein n=1 Tax=Varroa destructor TaxID=109461 RepID=A0A7M7KMG6_VARDE|nr:protein hu-li tai shao-like isoform X3 [Varroa destructor]XP_022691271.1 protein hu-li tai shao-like isoform X3 [Varroa jacobsoni]
MADESNGGTNGTFDPEDPELQRQMMRPADIAADMKEMDRRKRVEMIMNSQVFREELERIVESQLRSGYTPGNIQALQQVTDMLLPSSQKQRGCPLLPINDIRGVDGLRYSPPERALRCKMAALCRLLDMYGWAATAGQGQFTHATVRISQDQEHFLINPFGLLLHEVTASSLLKVDMQGQVIDSGTTTFSFARGAFAQHAIVHAHRPDIKAIVQTRHPAIVTVSAMKNGLMPVCSDAALLGDISYATAGVDCEGLSKALGPVNKIVFIRNQGALIGGDSIEEAFASLAATVSACEQLLALAPLGLDNVYVLSPEEMAAIREEQKQQTKDHEPAIPADEDKDKMDSKLSRRLRLCDVAFEAHMRTLDNSGLRTGYFYRQPLLRDERPRAKNDVEVPPSASSFGQSFDEDKWLSPLRKLLDAKKTQDKMRYVNSPNSYQRVEVLETGTADPRKITKWVQEGQAQGGGTNQQTVVKIEGGSHQFVPTNTDPAEFKRKQKEMKANRLNSKVTAGPQSNILEGYTWDEIRQMQDTINRQSGGDNVVLVGAASKGIIQRDFQHNAMVYKSVYQKNPFDGITDEELEEYRALIERKMRGEPIEDDIPECLRPLLQEPIAHAAVPAATLSSTPVKSSPTGVPPAAHRSPIQSPVSEEDPVYRSPSSSVRRSLSARMAAEGGKDQDKENEKSGDESKSLSSKEVSESVSSPSKSEKKKKKKSGGLSTASFFKKKSSKTPKEETA